ncbi:hypothetical protein ABW365_14985 [Enterococcus avium]
MKNKKIGSILAILVVCILGILLFEAKDYVHAIKNGDTSLAIPAPVIMVREPMGMLIASIVWLIH